MNVNEYQNTIDKVFRSRFPTWDQVPGGDPVRVLSEALAVSLHQTEVRYRALLDRVVGQAPLLMGLQPRRAVPARVRLHLVGNPKSAEAAAIQPGQVFGFKAGERKFETVAVSHASVAPGASQVIYADLVEVLEEKDLGTLGGDCWESLPLPAGLMTEPQTLVLRFPDETVTELHRCRPDALLVEGTTLSHSFLVAPQSLLFPAADELCRGYRADVHVLARDLRLATDPEQCALTDYKWAGEKVKALAEVSVVGVETPAVPAETEAGFRERCQLVLQQALQLFYQGPALSLEEVARSLNHRFPMIRCESILIDEKTETVLVNLVSEAANPVDAFTKEQVRAAVEAKVSLRLQVVVRDQTQDSRSGHG